MRNGAGLMDKPRPHPSGRPIRRSRERGRPIWRIPDDGPVTPRLQRQVTNAIGFVVRSQQQEESDD